MTKQFPHLITWLFAALAAALLGTSYASAQIAPGALSKAHAMLKGPTHCLDCHDTSRQSADFKCLDCHGEIRMRLADKKGLHPALISGPAGANCISCHSEHNGSEATIIKWQRPMASFDHGKTGYLLEGKHSAQTCRACHQAKNISEAARASLPGKDLDHTFLGLSRDCLGCHADEHRGQLSPRCADCHDRTDWKHAANYNHGRARFVLEGAHAKAACDKCHPTVEDAKPYIRFKGLPFENCTPCHSDPHKGAFQTACRSCHGTTETWKPTQISLDFDHSRTKYPLEGKHADQACAACHRRGNFKEPLAHDRCLDCHTKDPHRGQFADRADQGNCAACHTVTGFKPATFSKEQHGATRFPLKAAHSEIACGKCHTTGRDGIRYRMPDLSCASCHRDIHGGQFQKEPYGGRCTMCHTDTRFEPSTFTLAKHASTRFQLSGAHKAIACTGCHRPTQESGKSQPARFRFDDLSCTGCHQDPHQGQFASRMQKSRPDGSPSGCEACHSTRSWQELNGFEHDRTDFPLEGFHRTVACNQCHKSEDLSPGMSEIIFRNAPKQCSGCHDDIHGGQFKTASGGGECSQCHTVSKWQSITFDHDTRSTYRLVGEHRNVRCNLCHNRSREIDGKEVVFFKGTPRQCAACHGPLDGGGGHDRL